MTYEQFVERLDHVRPCGGGVTARCPAHDDRHNSLSVTPGRDRILIKCHAGCSIEKILEAMGLTLADLFYQSRNGARQMTTSSSEERLTLEQFARAKGFTCEFLRAHGVSEENQRLVFHYLTVDGQRAARQRIRRSLSGDKRFIWSRADGRPIPYGVWRVVEWRKKNVFDLFIVEGESDSLTLWLHHFAAIGIPGADNCSLLQATHVTWARRIYIVRENDRGGEVFERGLTGRLAELQFQGDVRVIEMSRAEVKDPNELHIKFINEPGAFESEFQALIELARPIELPVVGVEVVSAEQIQPERIRWLWPNRVPRAKLVVFAGPPGLGKSFVALDIAARLSTGAQWPDGTGGTRGRVIIFSAEDTPSDTIVPRLISQGAERAMIHIAQKVRDVNRDGELTRRSFSLVHDLPKLERLLDRYDDTALVVIDPVSAYTGAVDTHKNAEVRSNILDPLADLAHRRDVTILAVTHFNKGAGNGLDRIAGSIAFGAAPRYVWGFADDPEQPGRRLMLFGKTNVGPTVTGLAFRIVGLDEGQAQLQWLADSVTENLDDFLRRQAEVQKDANGSRLTVAKNMLLDLLRDGGRPAAEVEQHIRAAGVSESTYKRARWDLGVVASKERYRGGWVLTLPSTIQVQ